MIRGWLIGLGCAVIVSQALIYAVHMSAGAAILTGMAFGIAGSALGVMVGVRRWG